MQAQAAWLVVGLVAVATLSAHVTALTAFGKSNTPEKDQSAPKPKAPKGRVCQSQAECAGALATTCTLDKTDGKKHCLCRDGSRPINSKCAVIPNVPGKPCNEHADCVLNADCLVHNETRKKTCMCKEGYEFDPAIDDTLCSGCAALWPCVATLLAALLVLMATEPRPHIAS